MPFVLVVGRGGGQLFSYDTDSGEQESIGLCRAPKLMPSTLASLQKTKIIEYVVDIQRMLIDHIDVTTPVVLALHASLPDPFVNVFTSHFRYEVANQCRVKQDGQMGLNQVLREHGLVEDVRPTKI